MSTKQLWQIPMLAFVVATLSASAAFQEVFQHPGNSQWPKSPSSSLTVIPVCFRAPGTQQAAANDYRAYPVDYYGQAWQDKQAIVKDTIRNSWEKWTELKFTGWGTCPEFPTGYMYIDLLKTADGGQAYPWGYDPRGVRIRLGMETPDSVNFRIFIMHEFGHALGFHHEMDRPDAITAGIESFSYFDPTAKKTKTGCGRVEYPTGVYLSIYYGNSAVYDDISVMNYCVPDYGGLPTSAFSPSFRLSFGDISGAQKLYGRSVSGRGLKALPAIAFMGI